jgi:hypothetical protein
MWHLHVKQNEIRAGDLELLEGATAIGSGDYFVTFPR